MATLRKSANSSVPTKMKSETLILIDKYIQKDYSPEQVSAALEIKSFF
jgi:septum formation topological specificity factor MinE